MTDAQELRTRIEQLIVSEKYDDAAELVEKTLQETSDMYMQAMLLYEMGAILYFTQRRDEAMEKFTKSLSLFEDIDDARAGEIMFHIGGFYLLTGDLESARDIYERVLGLLPEGSRYHLGALHNLGDIHKKSGNLEEAVKYFEHTINLAIEMDDFKAAAYASENIAEVRAYAKDKAGAMDWLKKAIEYAERVGEQRIILASGLALAVLEGEPVESIMKRGSEIKTNGMIFAHDVADVYMTYSAFRSEEELKKLLGEALLLYSETGDGIMHQRAVESLNRLS